MLSAVSMFFLFLSFSISSTFIVFAFPIGIACFLEFQVSFDRHKHVIIHQRTIGEVHMSLFFSSHPQSRLESIRNNILNVTTS